MTTCACRPGTADDGWHEVRCEACIAFEMEEWGRVIAWSRNGDIVKEIAARRSDR